MAPRAIITGAAGLIGQYLVKTAPRWAPDWDVQGLTRADLDLTDRVERRRAWHSMKPDRRDSLRGIEPDKSLRARS